MSEMYLDPRCQAAYEKGVRDAENAEMVARGSPDERDWEWFCNAPDEWWATIWTHVPGRESDESV